MQSLFQIPSAIERLFTEITEVIQIPYTRVNKRMRLFAKLQGNMRLIPNMRLIAKGKIDHTSKTAMPSLVARGLTANVKQYAKTASDQKPDDVKACMGTRLCPNTVRLRHYRCFHD